MAHPTTTMTTATAKNSRLVARVGRIASARVSVRPMLYRDLRGCPVEELRKTELRSLGGAVLTLPARKDPVLVRRLLLSHDCAHVARKLRLHRRVPKISRLENQD